MDSGRGSIPGETRRDAGCELEFVSGSFERRAGDELVALEFFDSTLRQRREMHWECRTFEGGTSGKRRTPSLWTSGESRGDFRGRATPLNARSYYARWSRFPLTSSKGASLLRRKSSRGFLEVSIKSAGEVEYQLQLAYDCGVLRHHNWQSLTAETIAVRRMVIGLRRKLLGAPEPREPER